jgi:hypothetical protein
MTGLLPPADGDIHFGPCVRSASDALTVFCQGLSRPATPEVLLIARNEEQQMLMMLVVTDTVEPDHVLEVLQSILQVSVGTAVDSLVMASMRPGMPICIDDALIWWSLQDLAESYGIEITDWFVLTEDFFTTGYAPSPRELAGEEAAW